MVSGGLYEEVEVLNRGKIPNDCLPSLDMSQGARTTSPVLFESSQ